MERLWTNPSYIRSFIQDTSLVNTEIGDYMKIRVKRSCSNRTKNIMVFPGLEYCFSFYDAVYGTIHNIVALVDKVYDDQIKVLYTKDTSSNDTVDCSKCKNTKCKNNNNNVVVTPTCHCIMNPPSTEKYEYPTTYFVPVCNIIDINYMKNSSKGVSIMLLGISATVLNAIIIHMEMFDDSSNTTAIKSVDLKTGAIYNFTYEGSDGCVYESKVKVIKIEQDKQFDDCKCKAGKGYVRENVGEDNNVYTSYINKTEFMKQPPISNIRIIVDTSEDFSGRYEVIPLNSLRDCTLIEDGGTESPTTPTDPDTKKCNCECSCKKDNNTYEYDYSANDVKAVVNGETVTITSEGQNMDLTLDRLIKFYMGIE